MEHAVVAPRAGRVAEVAVAQGDQVEAGALLARLEPQGRPSVADAVEVVEVGPPDGLQSRPGIVPIAREVALIDALSRAAALAREVAA